MTRLSALARLVPFAVVVAFLLVANDCCPVNPPQNTVITAHGNTDWHIDTAEEFLFGTDMGGATTAANHAPNSWTRRHMHVDQTNMARYYHDKDEVATGLDIDGTSGIETAMLFFYAGHGSPTLWNTLGDNASQGNMCLADCPGGGMSRYYWQCSCQVFAHGPRNCGGSIWDYGCPGSFTGAADSSSHRNVYERWGPAIDPYLRMACGASTSAYCHEGQTNAIWDNYNNKGQDVADSFINGLTIWGHVVPLCITRGGASAWGTPLFDTAFTNQANTSGNTHFHIQYLASFASTPVSAMISEAELELPAELPVLRLQPGQGYESLAGADFEAKGEMMESAAEVSGLGLTARYHPASGAVYLAGAATSDAEVALETKLDESAYLEKAEAFLRQSGLSEAMSASSDVKEVTGEPVGRKMMIDVAPVEGGGDVSKTQKNVQVSFRRLIDIDGTRVKVLGAGGVTEVHMSNDGSITGASQIWRRIAAVDRVVAVKTYEEAYAEALGQLEKPEAYRLDQWEWGYKEAAGNVSQAEMSIVFWFGFVPADPEALLEYPPRMVEIAGQEV